MAFAFGLIHGFGFAGVMADLDLDNTRLIPALFGFNSGVEIGQLAVVLVSWPLSPSCVARRVLRVGRRRRLGCGDSGGVVLVCQPRVQLGAESRGESPLGESR